jgi:hypothetical protein
MNTFIFGYGSLINMPTNTELLNPNSRNFYPVIVKNIKRDLNVCGLNKTYFGVEDSKYSEEKTNGILFKVSDEELKKLEIREEYYFLGEINLDRIIFYDIKTQFYDYNSRENTKVLCFYSKPEHIDNSCKQEISKKYIYKCLRGCLNIGIDFTIDFIQMTHGLDKKMK